MKIRKLAIVPLVFLFAPLVSGCGLFTSLSTQPKESNVGTPQQPSSPPIDANLPVETKQEETMQEETKNEENVEKEVKENSSENTSSGDKDCKDFKTQKEAQAYFDAKGGSPTNNVDDLDRDHDGIACESLK